MKPSVTGSFFIEYFDFSVETTALSQNGLHHTTHPLMWHHIPEEKIPPLC